jgi:DNA-binding GntR family transcriptional regulator
MQNAIPRGARSAHVYERLRDLVVRGRLAPGARVVEQEVAQRMGVGRTPVREALQLLVQEGYLVAPEGGRRQLVVAPLRADEVDELFGIVAELEVLAVRRLGTLDENARRRLAGALREANRAFADTVRHVPVDLARAFDTHQAFHTALTAPLAGPRLGGLLDMVRPQIERYEWVYGALLEGRMEVAADEHEAIVRAVDAGNDAGAESALRANWRNAARRLQGAIGRMGERGIW